MVDTIVRSGIYRISNLVTGLGYYGSTTDKARREHEHFSKLNNQTHANPHLQNSWNKHGSDAFVFEWIEDVAPEHLKDVEQEYLDQNQDGYNINPSATRPPCQRGRKRSPESCERISQSQKGRRYSADARRNMSKWKFGRKHPQSRCDNISAGLRRYHANKKASSAEDSTCSLQ